MKALKLGVVVLLAGVIAAGLVPAPEALAAPCCSSCDRAFDRCVDSCTAQGTPLSVCFDLCAAQVINCYNHCIISC